MTLPPKDREYDKEWLDIMRRAYFFTRTVAEQHWPYRLRKDDVLDAVLVFLEVPEGIDLESDEVRTLAASAWGYYSRWYRELYQKQGQQLQIFDQLFKP